MKNLKVVDGDLLLTKQDFDVVVAEEELVQTVRELFSINLGEWSFDPTKGFDYFKVLGKNFDEEIARAALLDVAAQEPRIEDITDIHFEEKGRALTIKMKVNGQEVTVNAP